jgi:type I restriction enzyme, S subunit
MSSWTSVPLGILVKPIERAEVPVAGNSYRQVGVKLWGIGAYERESIDGGHTRYKTLSRVEADDIIVNKIWARNGSVAVVPTDLAGCYVSGEFPTFTPISDKLDPRWFHWITKTRFFWDQCDAKSRGTSGKNRIRPERFLEIEIPLPPLPEQRRIVARIEELATKINEARGQRQKAADNLPSLLLNQSRRLFTKLAKRFPDRKFGSFSPHVSSGPRNWARHYEERGYRFYRAQDVGPEGQLLHHSRVYIEPPPGEQGRSARLQPGDLLLVITGATVGRVALFPDGSEPGFVNQHVAICRLPSDEVDPEFAIWGLRTPDGQAQIIGQRYGQGKPGLNLANIRQLHLPFPPICEQHRIVAELNRLEAQVSVLKTLQRETAAELHALLRSILDKAFKGEL